MGTVVHKIQELEEITGFSKHEQVVQGVINAIDEKIVSQGSMLPSVNNMVKELGFASKTIVKAYTELKERGIVESKNRLGYFVVNEATDQKMKVALLLYAFHPFQEIFYNAFRKGVGENIQVDIFFHHNNIEVFETILGNIVGKYGMYAIAPIPHPNTKVILNKIPRNKLLLVDRYEKLDGEFSHVTQEFEIATYMALKELEESIREFDRLVLFFRSNSDYPIEILRAFEKFLEETQIEGEVQSQYISGSIQKGTVYYTVGDGDLWNILKDAKKRDWEVGRDIGCVSNNNSPVKEIICGGITTFSTDFEMMGLKAAAFIKSKNPIQESIPSNLIRRASL